MAPETWPDLPYDAWEPTKQTLHRHLQVVGKIRMALHPFRNHWWHVPLYVAPDGVRTGPIPVDGASLELAFDLREHHLAIRHDRAATRTVALTGGRSVADLYHEVLGHLDDLGVHVRIHRDVFDLPGPPLDECHAFDAYDADAVQRWWRTLVAIDGVFQEFAGWFVGKQSPVHLFWHSFDLALTRFSGRRAPVAADADPVTAEAYSHDVVSFGWWPGDDEVREPRFYAYAAPEPDGLATAPLSPTAARWDAAGGGHLATLAHDEVRTAADPRATLLAFLDAAYVAGARGQGWDLADLASSHDPHRGAR